MLLKVMLLAAVAVAAVSGSQCGVPAIEPAVSRLQSLINVLTGRSQQRIVGGVEAIPHSWPWQVALLAAHGAPTARCGGSIINNQWILTAGHCCVYRRTTTPLPTSAIKVRVGAHDLRSAAEANARTYDLAQLVLHPSYQNRPVAQNDFCLLQLDEAVTFSAEVSPVCLPDAEDYTVGQRCHISGWGETEQQIVDNKRMRRRSGRPSLSKKSTAARDVVSILRQVDVVISDTEQCRDAYKQLSGGLDVISTEMFCAEAPGKDSCQGDSGGPFVCQSTAGAPHKLVGVVSWGGGCADSRYPGVYAKTSTALEWIASVAGSV